MIITWLLALLWNIKYKDKNILIVTHGGTSVSIKCFFTQYPLEKLIDRDVIKGLGNCEIARYSLERR